jgi:protein O-mannosyl-transferase
VTQCGSGWQKWGVGLLLAGAVLAAFWPALSCGFVNYDDPITVTENPNVQQGLTPASLKWALTTTYNANWHPLTWVSHIIDYQLYGLKPAGHHLTSLLFHLASSVLLFLLLNRLTGAPGCSALAAALFALHPLRVQSVVWVAERKDVLSTFFWMLTVWAYVRYVEEFKIQSSKFKAFYGLSLVLFALGLMCKPMIVTLPFVLLLLDYWPLGRVKFGPDFSRRLIVEKIPFLILAACDSAVTFLAQKDFGAVATLARFPLSVRLGNIPVAYVRYIIKNVWPANLAVMYPLHPAGLLQACGAVGLLALVSILVVRQRRARPYLPVGWFWFLGLLVPVNSLVQAGTQGMADRYSYLPSVGLFIMLAWGLRDLAAGRPFLLNMLAVAGGVVVAACAVLTRLEIRHWRNTASLYAQAIKISDQSYLDCYDLGCYAKNQGDYAGAILWFNRALQAEPDTTPFVKHGFVHNNLGYSYLHLGDVSNAVAQFDIALSVEPHFPEVYYNLGCAFLTNHQAEVALQCLEIAGKQDASVPEIQYTLGSTLLDLGRAAEAQKCLEKALQLRPDFQQAQDKLAAAQRYQSRRGGSSP